MSKISTVGLGGAEHARFDEPHRDVANDPRLGHLVAIVLASSDERHALWSRWNGKLDWRQEPAGWMASIGTFGGMPVTVTLDFATIDGGMVVFADPVSLVVHHDMVERWLDAHLRGPETIRVGMSGFGDVLGTIRDRAATSPHAVNTVG